MSTDLKQDWPAPSRRRPIVIFGAGSIVRDAHLPAWAAGGYDVAGVYDPDEEKSRALAADYGLRALSEAEALSVEGAVYDLATPPAAHAGVLSAPDARTVVPQGQRRYAAPCIFDAMPHTGNAPVVSAHRIAASMHPRRST